MITLLAGMVFALLQSNVVTAAAPSSQEEARMIIHPAWIRRPDGNDLAIAYPRGAVADLKNGRVRMVCTVNDQGKLTDCDVTDETPAGWGFGKAALSLTGKFQMKSVDRDGSPVAGGRISIPVYMFIAGGS
jgi:periplasmic protein TonB